MRIARSLLIGFTLAAPDGVTGLNYAAFGLGYAILVLALTQIWRLYKEMRRERDLYRDALWRVGAVADASTASSLQIVKAEQETDSERRTRLLREAFKTIVESEKAAT